MVLGDKQQLNLIYIVQFYIYQAEKTTLQNESTKDDAQMTIYIEAFDFIYRVYQGEMILNYCSKVLSVLFFCFGQSGSVIFISNFFVSRKSLLFNR